MHTKLKIVLAGGMLLIGAGVAPRDALAQGYGSRGPGQQVYCASNDSRGTRCQVPWRDSVLAQQMSKAACVQGRTWGSDPHSVWVKGGCRGNFSDARGYGRHDRDSREVYCASNDSRGTRCKMPWRYSVLSRQMSDAACIEGRTWGSDSYSVWVKGGCRAQFRDARGDRPRR
ncbi:DUF3011 domain-containing protein [Rhodanobacter geophilus]|uniref:DUF3011 domain-containing protein n=1 Tax=Rhodanobacter geophilus TaxID=3162488 RepID=A0ABV3QPW2_9GAMM